MALRSFRSLVLILCFIPVLSAEAYEEPEAGAWFARQVSISAPEMAKNKERLERLVDWLYKDGAVFVGAVLSEVEINGSGSLRGLRIYLPINKGSREQIFRVVNRELARSGYRSENDTGQDTLVIWE